MGFDYSYAVCVYYITDEDEVTVSTTLLKGDETLNGAALRVMKENYLFDVDADMLWVFMIHPVAWQFLKNVEWPKSPYDDIDPEWGYSIEQCKYEVYKACRNGDAQQVKEEDEDENAE